MASLAAREDVARMMKRVVQLQVGVAVLQILLSVALTACRAVAHPTTLSAALTVRAVAHQIFLSAVPTMPVVHQTSLSVAATTVVQLEQHAVRVAVDAALLG